MKAPDVSANITRIVIADNHPMVLAGIKAVIALEANIVVVGEASNGSAAFQMIVEQHPDIAVIDISLSGWSSLTIARRLREAGVVCKMVVLTMHEEPAFVRQALELGVSGYVLKRSTPDELVRVIRIVADGGIYFDPIIAGQIIETAVRRLHVGDIAAPTDLSEREVEVLRLTAYGHGNKAIASKLGLGVKTVDTYKARAMDKLGFHSRVDLISYAVGKGWFCAS